MSATSATILNEFRKLSTQAEAAEQLFTHIWRGLTTEAYAQGRAFCDELTARAEAAAIAYRAQLAEEEAASRRAYTARACPITPLDNYNAEQFAAACDKQRESLSYVQAA